MTAPSPRILRRSALAASCAGLIVVAGGLAPALASGSKQHKPAPPKPVVAGTRYLALGDSVPFGFRESNSIPMPNYTKPKSFIGYPEDVAANLGLKLTNAACPGETTSSFISATAQSNGCENVYTVGKPPKKTGSYRSKYPLHVAYKGSQLAFAEKYLKEWPKTRLVTIMLGANDGFICLATPGCIDNLTPLENKITKHMTTIFAGIRNKAHYTGQLVLVNYYSFNYTNPVDNAESQDVNTALEKAAKPFHVETADSYAQFQKVSEAARGDACTAGLLTPLKPVKPDNCGVHPTFAGAAVLAQGVEQAIKK
jgi:lysophospholipase L1-like esterase